MFSWWVPPNSGAAPGKNRPVEGRRSVLMPRWNGRPDAKSRMDEELLLEALGWMVMSRLYDQRVIALQRQGQFGVYSPGMVQGSEAEALA